MENNTIKKLKENNYLIKDLYQDMQDNSEKIDYLKKQNKLNAEEEIAKIKEEIFEHEKEIARLHDLIDNINWNNF